MDSGIWLYFGLWQSGRRIRQCILVDDTILSMG